MFSWIDKVIPQPPETPRRAPSDAQQGDPEKCDEKVTCMKKASAQPAEVKPQEALQESERSSGGVFSWLAQGLGKVVPQPVESPVLTHSSKVCAEQKVSAVNETEELTENGPTDQTESSSIGVLSWLSQGLEKVVPQPAWTHRTSTSEHMEAESEQNGQAEVKVEETCVPASPPPSPLPVATVVVAAPEPVQVQPAPSSTTETASSDKGSGVGVLSWLMQGLGKVVPIPESSVPLTNPIEEVKATVVEEHPVTVTRKDSKGSAETGVLGWISHGLEKVIPQPVTKDSQTITLCQVEQKRSGF